MVYRFKDIAIRTRAYYLFLYMINKENLNQNKINIDGNSYKNILINEQNKKMVTLKKVMKTSTWR